MAFLLDTNCWMQLVRRREHAAASQLFRVVDCVRLHKLDVDDSYQYVAAEFNSLHLVSLDTDFDRTARGRLTPAAALQLFMDEQQKSSKEA